MLFTPPPPLQVNKNSRAHMRWCCDAWPRAQSHSRAGSYKSVRREGAPREWRAPPRAVLPLQETSARVSQERRGAGEAPEGPAEVALGAGVARRHTLHIPTRRCQMQHAWEATFREASASLALRLRASSNEAPHFFFGALEVGISGRSVSMPTGPRLRDPAAPPKSHAAHAVMQIYES